jgi:hypothetical protein
VKKIPLWRSIGSGYSFAFGNLATIIGLIWLPMAVLCVAGYFAISRYFDGVLTAIANGNRFAAYSGAEYYYLYRIAALVLESMVVVSVMRQAFTPRRKSVFVHFALGPAELRMFVAFVAAALVMLTIEIASVILLVLGWIGIGLATQAIGAIGGVQPLTIAIWCDLALTLVLLAAIVLVNVRLTFLLAPVTVAENRINLVRSWELSRRNFWRAFWILVVANLPLWLLYLAIQLAFVGFAVLSEAPMAASPLTLQLSASVQAAALRMHGILVWLPYLYGAWFLVRPLFLGISSGAAAAAYRALVPGSSAVSTPAADGPLRAAIG